MAVRLAWNLEDLRRLVRELTARGVRVEFVKEGLTFTGEDTPMATLLLSVMGAFAEFERALIRERQREGIALAKRRGAYRGRKKALTPAQADDAQRRALAGEAKAALAGSMASVARRSTSICEMRHHRHKDHPTAPFPALWPNSETARVSATVCRTKAHVNSKEAVPCGLHGSGTHHLARCGTWWLQGFMRLGAVSTTALRRGFPLPS